MSDVQPQPSQGGGGGNILTNRIGPLPGWAWLVAVALLAYLYMRNKSNQSNQQAQSQAQSSGGSVLTNSAGQPIDYLQQETVATPVQNPDTQGQGTGPQMNHQHYHNQGTITPVTGAASGSDSLSTTENGTASPADATTQVTTPQTS